MSVVRASSIVELTHEALMAHAAEFCGFENGGFVYRDKHMVVIAGPSGIAETICTSVRIDPGFDAGKFMTRTHELFERNGLGYAVLLRDECDADIDIVADNLGMPHLSPPLPRMITTSEVEETPGIEVRPVTDGVQLEHWFGVVGGAFGSEYPVDALRLDVSPPERILEHRNITLLLAYIDSEPVSGGMMYSYGRTSYISNVGTIPAFRRRGAASAVVRHATNAGLRNGAEHSFLFASHGAERIWERLGYRTISHIHHRMSVSPA